MLSCAFTYVCASCRLTHASGSSGALRLQRSAYPLPASSFQASGNIGRDRCAHQILYAWELSHPTAASSPCCQKLPCYHWFITQASSCSTCCCAAAWLDGRACRTASGPTVCADRRATTSQEQAVMPPALWRFAVCLQHPENSFEMPRTLVLTLIVFMCFCRRDNRLDNKWSS